MEELLIKNLNNAIRGIKLGSKNPSDVGAEVAKNLERLKLLNEGMHADIIKEYGAVVAQWKIKNKKD